MRVKLDNSEFGIPNCWYNITRKHSRIEDLISDLTIKFDLPEIQLEIDGFLLLENELTLDLLRENDLISVIHKSRKRLCTLKAVEKGSGENAMSLESGKVDGSDLKELKPGVVSRTFLESESSSEGSSDSSEGSSDSSDQVENSKKIVESVKESDDSSSDSDSESSGSSGSVSESDQESSVDSAKTVTQDVTVPPVMSYYINPPMSLVGKNKRKLVPKMLNQERVHLHFEGIEKSTVQGDNKAQEEEIKAPDNVVFSTVRLYDDEPSVQHLSASQKRRIRRKKAQIYKTLESLNNFNDKDDGGIPKEQGLELQQSITNISQNDESQNNNNRGSGITNISELIPGKKIAYQILEMSFSYQPEISGYMEAIVMAIDYLNKMVTLKSLETIQQEASMEEVDGQETPFRKFELPPDDDYTPMAPQNEVFIVCFNDLISVKILE